MRKLIAVALMFTLSCVAVASTTMPTQRHIKTLRTKQTTMHLPVLGEVGQGEHMKVLVAEDNCIVYYAIIVFGVVIWAQGYPSPCSGGGKGGGGGSAF